MRTKRAPYKAKALLREERMRPSIFGFATAVLLLLFGHAALASCDEDTIETISSDGDLIVLGSGESFDVEAGDEATSALWVEGDNVLICGYTIIDKDQDDERVEVTPH